MDRRNFIKVFGAGIAAFGYDPERFLWVPGAKTIFIPSQAGDLEAIRKLNEATFQYVYGREPWTESIINGSNEAGSTNAFQFYYDNLDWEEHDL